MEPSWWRRIDERTVSMHVDLRISQKCSTVELLYLLFPDFNFYCKEDGMDFSQKELERTDKPSHFSWQLRQASSKISRIHSYRSHKARKCCYTENELVIGALSYWHFECFHRSCTTKVLPIVQRPVVLSPSCAHFGTSSFWTTTQYTTGRNFVSLKMYQVLP